MADIYQLHDSYNSLGKEFKNLFEGLVVRVKEQKAEADKLREELQRANDRILQANGDSASKLAAALQEERIAIEADRMNLFTNIKALISASAETQDARLNTKLTNVKDEISSSRKLFAEADSCYRTGMDNWTQRQEDIARDVNDKKEVLKVRMQADWKVCTPPNPIPRPKTNLHDPDGRTTHYRNPKHRQIRP
jgi:kinesin family protein 11